MNSKITLLFIAVSSSCLGMENGYGEITLYNPPAFNNLHEFNAVVPVKRHGYYVTLRDEYHKLSSHLAQAQLQNCVLREQNNVLQLQIKELLSRFERTVEEEQSALQEGEEKESEELTEELRLEPTGFQDALNKHNDELTAAKDKEIAQLKSDLKKRQWKIIGGTIIGTSVALAILGRFLPEK